MIYVPTRTIRSRFPNRELLDLILKGDKPSSCFLTGETALDFHYQFRDSSENRTYNLRMSWMLYDGRMTFTANSIGVDGTDFRPEGSMTMTSWNSKLRDLLRKPGLTLIQADPPEGPAYQDFFRADPSKLECLFGKGMFPTASSLR